MLKTVEVESLAREVESLLNDWKLNREHEKETCPGLNEWKNRESALQIESSNYGRHQQWASRAEELLNRMRIAATHGMRLPNAAHLEDALGRTQARLLMTPEMTARAMDQVAQGKFISVKEMRDELDARLRA
jgi:hypothetical protein